MSYYKVSVAPILFVLVVVLSVSCARNSVELSEIQLGREYSIPDIVSIGNTSFSKTLVSDVDRGSHVRYENKKYSLWFYGDKRDNNSLIIYELGISYSGDDFSKSLQICDEISLPMLTSEANNILASRSQNHDRENYDYTYLGHDYPYKSEITYYFRNEVISISTRDDHVTQISRIGIETACRYYSYDFCE